MKNISLGNKILFGVAVSVFLATLACIATVYALSVKNRVSALHQSMGGLLEQSETMIDNMDAMHRAASFDQPHLLARAKEQVGGDSLKTAYAKTDLYNTIPVVAAWKSVAEAAKRSGYDFFTPSRPGFVARNPKNANGSDFADAFKAFEAGQKEYFIEDKQKGELVLAHPIYLSASCLTCHGDPANSPTKDGLDVLGFPMENAHVGDLKGAFVLKAKLTGDPVVKASVQAMSIVGGIILVAVVVVFYFLNDRLLVRPMGKIIHQLAGSANATAEAAGQINHSSQRVAEAASEQAASLEETSASLEEISSMTKRNADNAINSKNLSQQASQSAATGLERLGELSHTLNAIKSAVADMEAAVSEMQGSSQEIAKIIKTIDEIAFQTNLLALNAAVEAARAGEAGMGFAVVADEVRALAQRSAQAARDTSDKIEHAIKRSELGGVASAKVVQNLGEVETNARNIEEVFNGIVAQIKSLDEVIGEISAASREQSQGVGEVNMAVSQMDKVTQSNAANAEENAGAAEQLQAQAGSLQDIVGGLDAIVNGGSPHSSGSPAAPTAPARPAARPSRRSAEVIPMLPEEKHSPTAADLAAPAAGSSRSGSFKDF